MTLSESKPHKLRPTPRLPASAVAEHLPGAKDRWRAVNIGGQFDPALRDLMN
jgi:hypothetical protein